MRYDCDIFVRMRDADVGHAVFQIRLAVVMVVEVHLFLEHFIQERPDGQSLHSLVLVAYDGDLLHLVVGYGTEARQLLFRLCNLPYGDLSFVVKFLS